ncbi:Zn(II)2Cys6 transcription factor [Aspergillus ibericus CBS 121593]|uniref:Zn(2)-C6 fungal-type domain-containing protein n=1 Tax=Aspergillus ibericus CBS 121593 TaxID=1448316 RepID=A0A395H269_9EURO|nr:hypothetical protein BO80DRAFT_501488 [Aspergillus ibericus CBS 121593]RAL01977.1 hypothetical protein BO80DRAFT_501488 [Aspergillus ibericus CBS 121593]
MSDPENADPRQGRDAEPSGPEPACDECRIRKVRCDRELPVCSSCRKSGLTCQYTQKGKRVNHTKKLVNDVQLLGNRLERIEEALLRYLSVASASNSPPTSSVTPYSPDAQRRNAEDSWNRSDNSEGSPDGLSDLHGGSPGNHVFGPSSSMAALYVEAQAAGDQLAASLSQQGSLERPGGPPTHESALRTQIAEVSALFQRLATDSPMLSKPEHHDDLPPFLPPRALLEVFLETYFTELSPLLPIYDRPSVLAAMHTQYGSTLEAPDPAWIVSLSSILLQTLEAKSTGSQKADTIARSTLEVDLQFQLLLNIRRCYNHFERLLQPRVANVQALLSMALVALRYFRFTMFETVFTQACELAKSMGLHQSSFTANAKQCAECQTLFWSLFILDKHISLVAGKSCLLPSYDCGIPLPPSTTTGILLDDLFAARIALAHIEEEIVCSLYSAQAPRLSPNHLSRRAHKLIHRLNDWTSHHSRILYPPASTTITAQQTTELRYALCISRVLVQRRIPTPESRQIRLEHARTGLRLLQELCESYHPDDSISNFTVFESILLHYPIVLFLEVYIHLLAPTPTHTTLTSDTNALRFFASRADPLAANASATSHAVTIRSITQLCSQIATSLLHPPIPISNTNTNTKLYHSTPAIQNQHQHPQYPPEANIDPTWDLSWTATPSTHPPGRDLHPYGEWKIVSDLTPGDFEEMLMYR